MEEDTSQALTTTTTTTNKRTRNDTGSGTAIANAIEHNRRFDDGEKNDDKVTANGDDDYDKDDDDDEEYDSEAWETLSKSFRRVQTVLDQNRALIQLVNENHQSKLRGNLVQNVELIREINGNISKVIGLYSDLSVDFTNIVHQRRALASDKNNAISNNCNNNNNNKAESGEP